MAEINSLSDQKRGSLSFQYSDAVNAVNICFEYSKTMPILTNVNMRVPIGSIYGLLGPSGCGKTTLLKCITTALKPSSGQLYVFGMLMPSSRLKIPGSQVGYMPQELSHYDDLNVSEFLWYFGRLNLLSDSVLTKRMKEIIELLGLNENKGFINTLSGGQKRRVSLAVALMHKPALTILDEPTVGVDPILRHKIWNHLISLSKNDQMTIIITTHYIEEATKANVIGLMRHGQLIAEDAPNALNAEYNAKTLEETFLHLCFKQDSKQTSLAFRTNSVQCVNETIQDNVRQKVKTNKYSFLKEWLIIFLILLWKANIRFFRHPEVIIFFVIFPIVVTIFVSSCLGRAVFDIPFGVVNHEEPKNFSLDFLSTIDRDFFIIREYNSFDDAYEATKIGEIWGFLYIRDQFSQSLVDRFLLDFDADVEIIKKSVIKIYADLTNTPKTINIIRELELCYHRFLQELLIKYDYNPAIVNLPIIVDEILFGFISSDPLNREFIICGVLILFTYTSSCALMSAILINEKIIKMFELHFVTGVTTTQLFFSNFIQKIFIFVFQTVFVIVAVTILYDFEWRPSMLWAIVVLFLLQLSGMSMGLFFSVIMDDMFYLAIVITSFMLFSVCIGGVVWPVEAIPYWMQWVSYFQPTCQPAVALRSILLKDFGPENRDVWLGMVVSLSYTIICCFVGNKLFKY